MFNDVALTSDGAFYVTEMYNRMMAFDELIAAGIAGENTGVVWSWSARDGFQVVTGSQGSFPNGIVINPAEDTLFVNYWVSGETTKLDLASGAVVATHRGGRAIIRPLRFGLGGETRYDDHGVRRRCRLTRRIVSCHSRFMNLIQRI